MFAAGSDVWHRKGVGSFGGGFAALCRHAGQVFKPGAASVVRCRWTWAADEAEDGGDRWAYARFYALYRNSELTLTPREHMYALLAALGWQLDHATLVVIHGAADVVPAAILAAMRADPLLLVDTNWLVSEGFETIGDVEPEIHRARLPHGRVATSPGCLGRVTLTFTEHKIPRPAEVVKFEAWPTAVPLCEWYPKEAKALVAKYRNVPAGAPADAAGPKLNVPLKGGPAIVALDDVAVQASSERRIVAYRYTPHPDAKYLRITDVTTMPMKAVRCFTAEQLKQIATDESTQEELAKKPEKRLQLVNEHALYPALNSCYKVSVRPEKLLEKIFIVPTMVAFAATRIQSPSSYFVGDHAVGPNGQLVPMRATPGEVAVGITKQLFVPNHAVLAPVAHAALQDAVINKVMREKQRAWLG